MTDPRVVLTALALAAALLWIPHRLPLDRVAPRWAARTWGAALGLRALMMVCLVALSFFWLPATAEFTNLAGKKWHTTEPLAVANPHLDLSGDWLAHSTALAPLLVLGASMAAFVFALLRTAFAFERRLRRNGVGRGFDGSLLVAEGDVYVGVPGLGPRRIVVSAGAVASLDDEELQASVAHERGHLELGHRRWVLVGSVLRALGRPLPGTKACERGLALSLEREADEYAVGTTGQATTLASAILKVARSLTPAATMGLASASHLIRMDQLLEGGRIRSSSRVEAGVAVLACCLIAFAAFLALSVWTVLAGHLSLGLALGCSL